MIAGDRSIGPEQEGQLSGAPFRSLAIKCSAWAGLYVAGRGLRIVPPQLLIRGFLGYRQFYSKNNQLTAESAFG